MVWRARATMALTGLALFCSTMLAFPAVFADRWVAGERSASEPAFIPSTLRIPAWELGTTWRRPAEEAVQEYAQWGTVLSPSARLPGAALPDIELVHTRTPDWLVFAIQTGAILAVGGAFTMLFHYGERWQRARRLQPGPHL